MQEFITAVKMRMAAAARLHQPLSLWTERLCSYRHCQDEDGCRRLTAACTSHPCYWLLSFSSPSPLVQTEGAWLRATQCQDQVVGLRLVPGSETAACIHHVAEDLYAGASTNTLT